MKFPIYLDNHATTPLDPRVLEEMMPYLTTDYGNPASMDHAYGAKASQAVEQAREQIGRSIHSRPEEIIFTGGATESDNLALLGIAEKYSNEGDHIITCVTEHKAVLDTCKYLERKGKKITYLPVNREGMVDTESLKAAITDKTILISIMMANNEIGTIAPIEEIGRIAHNSGVLFHTDAAQAIGQIPVDVEKMQIDMMSISAHKTYGPKGIGALYVRRRNPKVLISPLVHGGGHERGIRSGTLNVPSIVGFGKALEISRGKISREEIKFKEWGKLMFGILKENIHDVELNGHPYWKLPKNLNISFQGIEGKAIINAVRAELAISASSACTSDAIEASHVLLALGMGEDRAHSSIRIGFGRFNSDEEIEYATNKLTEAILRLQRIKI